MNLTDSDFQAAAHCELEKFLRIAAEITDAEEGSALMPFSLIDEHWHLLLSDQQAYQALSRQVAGVVVGHQECQGYGELEWVRRYKDRHGPLPEIWFWSHTGEFDRGAMADYRRSGEWRANWTCGSYIPMEDPGEEPRPPQPQPGPVVS